MEIRPFDPDAERDRTALRELKRDFEFGLHDDPDTHEAYRGKVTEEYRDRYLGWVRRCIDDEPRSVLLADEGGSDPDAVAGYVFVLPERLAMVWDAAVLNELFVRPRLRGTGVADDLIEAAIDVAREQSLPMDRIVLDVDRENERARSFYRRHGFEHWGEMVAREL
jgi:ribosomal protein S18 acetylase RimI-like enzyme